MTLTGVVIPCYNEEKRLDRNSFIDYYNNFPDVIICFVNDGSRDNTEEILRQIQVNREDRIRLITYAKNEGKAEAVRRGIEHILEKDLHLNNIGYLDADLSTSLEEFRVMVDILEGQSYKIICGSRIKRMGARIERKLERHLIGRFFASLISLTLQMPFYDTQCGAKVFTQEIAQMICEHKFYSSWLFDVEIFLRMKRKYGLHEAQCFIFEYPLNQWIEKGGSKISFMDIFKIPFELIRINFYYKRLLNKRT